MAINKKRRARRNIYFEERLAIARYLNENLSIAEIARILDRSYDVVWREVNHKKVNGVYNPVMAEEEALESRQMSEKQKQLRSCLTPEVKEYIENKLALKWSPRQISARMYEDIGVKLTFKTIYRYIKDGKVKVNVEKDLRFGGKKYNKTSEKRGKIKVGDRAIMYRPYFGDKS